MSITIQAKISVLITKATKRYLKGIKSSKVRTCAASEFVLLYLFPCIHENKSLRTTLPLQNRKVLFDFERRNRVKIMAMEKSIAINYKACFDEANKIAKPI